jgi:5-(carboxyamino)imidazole ribonucleotide synthase
MFNWIGDLPDLGPVLRAVDAHWHDYGKQARPGRKVGHATLCAPQPATLAARLADVATALERLPQAQPALDALTR